MKIFLGSLLFSSVAMALPPPVPSAGVVERELEKEYEATPLTPGKKIPSIQIDIPEEQIEMPAGITVFVSQLNVEGNESIPTEEIVAYVESCLDQELNLASIYDICHLVEQLYAQKGYFLTRVYPPPQTIENEELTIEVIEGKLGNVTLQGNCYYTDPFILSYFSSLQGRPLREDQFLRALILLNENKDLSAAAVFEKGESFGYADAIINVEDDHPFHLYLSGNNYGRFLTTNVRGGGRLDWGTIFCQGDKLSIAEVVGLPADALYFTDATYTVPLTRSGASLELAYLFSKFKVKEETSFHPKGSSNIATVKYNQALTRTRSMSIDVFTYFDYKQIKNYALGALVSFDKLRVLTLGTLIDHIQPSYGRDYRRRSVKWHQYYPFQYD